MSEPSTALRPGEIDLEAAPAPAPAPAPAAAVVPAVDPAAADPAGDADPAPAVDPAAEPEPAARGRMLEELIEHRTERRRLEKQLQSFAPVLERLTPEVQRALVEGRIQLQPPAQAPDQRKEQLQQRAERLRLYTLNDSGEKVYDLDAAARVEQEIRDVAKEVVAPYEQQSLAERATTNVNKALEFASANGYDVDFIRDTYQEVLGQPNGAAMVADPKVAETIWYQAIGRATAAGKLPKARPAAAAPPPVPAAIVADPAGRRTPAVAAITLSPGLQRVYRENGVDPTKTITATKAINYHSTSIDLE